MSGINNEDVYYKVIDFLFPKNNITFDDIKLIFQNNSIELENTAIIDIMKEYYGVQNLTKSKLKDVDIGSVFSETQIKEGINSTYSTENNGIDVEKLLSDIQIYNSKLDKYSLDLYLKDNNIEKIDSFCNYMIDKLK